MYKKIKHLTGRNIYLQMPPKKDTKVIVDENTKEALQKTMLKELSSLTIHSIGPLADKNLNVGDKVLVDPKSISGQGTVIIPLEDDKGEEIMVVLVQDYQIIHVWDDKE